jgi:hypothetical protein
VTYNMQRLPYGAQVFEAEVKDRYPDAEFEYDDRDGLGIYRLLKIALSKEGSDELGELLAPIMESSDPRITGWIGMPGAITVMFTATDEAENNDPFHLARIADTLLPQSVVDKIEKAREKPEDTKPRPARKTAKKAAPK